MKRSRSASALLEHSVESFVRKEMQGGGSRRPATTKNEPMNRRRTAHGAGPAGGGEKRGISRFLKIIKYSRK